MRLIKQYRGGVGHLLGRLAIAGAVIGSITVLSSVIVSIFSAQAVSSDDRKHDQALLRDLYYGSDQSAPIEEQIAKREQVIAQLRDRVVISQLNRELAALYEAQGQGNLASGNLSVAEQSFQTASELDPGNPGYFSDMAQLYADAAVQQSEGSNRLDLLKSSTVYFQDAINREFDADRRRVLFNKAADANYNLAKEELKIPGKKTDAITDLEKARDLAAPGSRIATDVSEMMFLVHS